MHNEFETPFNLFKQKITDLSKKEGGHTLVLKFLVPVGWIIFYYIHSSDEKIRELFSFYFKVNERSKIELSIFIILDSTLWILKPQEKS